MALVYAFVFERERVLAAAGPGRQAAGRHGRDGGYRQRDAPRAVTVVACVQARRHRHAVVLRGRTEADRQVELRAETSGKVISEPLRKGAFVEAGDVLCRLDPAARQAAWQEAKARRAEARGARARGRARLEEAQARLARGGRDQRQRGPEPVRGRVRLADPRRLHPRRVRAAEAAVERRR